MTEQEYQNVPGQMHGWMRRRMLDMAEKASKGQLYQTNEDQFEAEFMASQNAYSAPGVCDEEQLEDLKKAVFDYPIYKEHISRSRRYYAEVMADGMKRAEKNDEFARAFLPKILAAIFIVYAAIAAYIGEKLVSTSFPIEYKEPLLLASIIPGIGVMVAGAGLWWIIMIAIQERDYDHLRYLSWDPDQVQKGFYARSAHWGTICIVLSIIAIPLGGATFVYSIYDTVKIEKPSASQVREEDLR